MRRVQLFRLISEHTIFLCLWPYMCCQLITWQRGCRILRGTIRKAPVVFILQRLDNLKISAATNTPMSANLPDWLHKGDSSMMKNSSPQTNWTYTQLQRRNSARTRLIRLPWVFSMNDSHYALKNEITSGVRVVILLIASVCVYS